MELTLHHCDLNDLEQLGPLARDTFVASFGHLNDPEDFQDYMNTAFSDEILRAELLNPDSEFYMVRDSDLLGYFKLNYNTAQTDIGDEHSCELERIYVASNYQGIGIGEWMVNQAKIKALRRNKNYMWLGVWEENESAIRFYEKLGFVKFGEHPYYIGSDKQTDWLMRIDLVPS